MARPLLSACQAWSRVIGLLALAVTAGCGSWNADGPDVPLLRRIPSDQTMVISIRPESLFQSRLLQSALALQDEQTRQQVQQGWDSVRRYCGIRPLEDIDQVILMSEDVRQPRRSAGAILFGDFRRAFLDSLTSLRDVVQLDTLDIRGERIFSVALRKDDQRQVLVSLSDTEIMLAVNREQMQRMVELKHGTIVPEHLDRIIRRYREIPHTAQTWWMLPLGSVMEDVLAKARELRPDFKMDMLQISHVQGGMDLNGNLAIGLQAYCDNTEQSRLLEDALKGLLALGKLTGGMIPQVRPLLQDIEIVNNGTRVDVLIDIPEEELQALQAMAVDVKKQ